MEIRKKHPILSKILSCGIAVAILFAYILLTNPSSVALPLLLVPFVLIGYILFVVSGLVVHVFSRGEGGLVTRLLPPSIGFIGVALMVLSSLHQLTWKDSVLVVLFTALFWLYIWRADFLHKK